MTRIGRDLLLLMVFIFLANSGSHAEPLADARMQVGINLFPTFLAARVNLPENIEHIAVVFAERGADIQTIAERLRDRIRKRSVTDKVTLTPLSALLEDTQTTYTALFIAQTLTTDELDQVLSFALTHQLLTFSPLPGDVERGVLGGIAVSDRILPSLNMQTLRDHGIELKPFFKKVSDRYEPRSSR